MDTAFDVVRSVATKQRSAREATADALARIDAIDGSLNSCCEVRADLALAQADAIDARLARGEMVGALAGVPIGVKDLEDAAGYRTSFGDPAHAADAPRTADSIEVARLRAAGAVVVAKTNTPAYGFHAETENLVHGATRNPWALSRTCGGSSGGSAAAVAAGIFTLCTGSDGGGSIRIPSEVCGLTGFKPTHGVVPGGDESFPAWGPFSTRGPMARTAAEIACALDVVRGFSARDLLSFELAGSFADAVGRASLDGVRIAWSPTLGHARPDSEIVRVCEAAIKVLESHGARVELVEQVFPAHPGVAWMRRAAPGSLRIANAAPGAWDERFLPVAIALARFGEHVSVDALLDAEAGAHEANLALAALFERFDVVASPGLAAVPPRVGEASPYGPGWAGDMTLAFNLVRAPAAVVPCGFVVDDGDELPIGLQLAAARTRDLELMSVVAAAEQALGFVGRPPPVCAG